MEVTLKLLIASVVAAVLPLFAAAVIAFFAIAGALFAVYALDRKQWTL